MEHKWETNKPLMVHSILYFHISTPLDLDQRNASIHMQSALIDRQLQPEEDALIAPISTVSSLSINDENIAWRVYILVSHFPGMCHIIKVFLTFPLFSSLAVRCSSAAILSSNFYTIFYFKNVLLLKMQVH